MYKDKLFCNINSWLTKIECKIKCQNLIWPGNQCGKVELELDKSSRVEISRKAIFSTGCCIRVRGNAVLKIGDGVYFNNNCILTAREKIIIGDRTIFGPGVAIFDNDHAYKEKILKRNLLRPR